MTREPAKASVLIITHRLVNNYGAILQAYALQEILRRMGYKPETLNYCTRTWIYRPLSVTRRVLSFFKRLFLNRRPYDVSSLQKLHSKQQFEEWKTHESMNLHIANDFIHEHITLTREFDLPHEEGDLRKLCYKNYIVGSDQVWRGVCYINSDLPFLGFTKNFRSVQRIAYAASFGIDHFDITGFPGLSRKDITKMLRRFNAVSVREADGIAICRNELDIKNAVQMPDPTFLLQKEDYISLIHEKYPGTIAKQDYILSYILDFTQEKENILQRVAEFRGKPIRKFVLASRTAQEGMPTTAMSPSVFGWLKGFFEADCIVTDSFHGTVFSILFQKDFIVLLNQDRGLSRIYSLLQSCNLSDRIVSDSGNCVFVLKNKADFSDAEKMQRDSRIKALDFLKKNLSGL